METVDHPKHYQHPSGVECVDIAEWLPFNVGNALKYVWRAGQKGDKLEDLRKARWYLVREHRRMRAYDEATDTIGAIFVFEDQRERVRKVVASDTASALGELLSLLCDREVITAEVVAVAIGVFDARYGEMS